MWPFSKRKRVASLPDRVWLTEAIKRSRVAQEIADEAGKNAGVLVVSHFTGPLLGMHRELAARGVAADCIDHDWAAQDTARLVDPDGPRVVVTPSAFLPEPHPHDTLEPADRRAPSVFCVVVERHPLLDEDDLVVSFLASLPCRARIRFHLSFEDALMKATVSDTLARTMKTLGLKDDECIESPFVSRGVRSGQKSLRKRDLAHVIARSSIAETGEEWLQRQRAK